MTTLSTLGCCIAVITGGPAAFLALVYSNALFNAVAVWAATLSGIRHATLLQLISRNGLFRVGRQDFRQR